MRSLWKFYIRIKKRELIGRGVELGGYMGPKYASEKGLYLEITEPNLKNEYVLESTSTGLST